MGQSTNAMLSYGYDIGGGEESWKIKDIEEYEPLVMRGFNSEDDDEEDNDFSGYVEKAMLKHVGFTETDYNVEGYFDRRRAALAALPVKIEIHCHGEYPMYLLVAFAETVYRGQTGVIDFQRLEDRRQAEGWDAKLATGLEVLGIEPTQEEPSWLLNSYWG